MFRKLRILILLYILAFVAAGSYFASARSTDWDDTLWVYVHPVNGDGSSRVQAYIDGLTDERFDPIERYLADQAARYGIELGEPFRLLLAAQVHRTVPQIPEEASILDVLVWSLRMRWFAARVRWASDRPSPDIEVFAIYHDDTQAAMLDRSTALKRGLIAVTHLFANPRLDGSNQVVMAHELLHTLGASDKYQPGTNLPLFPIGYADRDASPLHPQSHAELMAGRIPLKPELAEMPSSLRQTLIGPETALEIGWLPTLR